MGHRNLVEAELERYVSETTAVAADCEMLSGVDFGRDRQKHIL